MAEDDFEYVGWTDEQANEDAATVEEGSNDKLPFWTCKAGEHLVRALPVPPSPDPATPARAMLVTYVHKIELPGRPVINLNCPHKMTKGAKPCPVCKKVGELKAKKNSVDRETAYGINWRLRVFMLILDRSAVKEGAKIWGFGKTVFEQLRSLRNDPDIGDFFRTSDDGYDLKVKRVGTTKNDTEYFVRPSTKTCALGDNLVLQTLPDWSRLSEILPYEIMRAKLNGQKIDRAMIEEAQRKELGLPEPVEPWDAERQGKAPAPAAAASPLSSF